MSRRGRPAGPLALKKHKRSGRGYALIAGTQVWFGPYSEPETHLEFEQFVAWWTLHGKGEPDLERFRAERLLEERQEEDDRTYLVRDLVADYLDHCDSYYRLADGTPSSEAGNMADSMLELLHLL